MTMLEGGCPTVLNAVTVYCGSSRGRGAKYMEVAQDFGRRLAAENLRLVWGGGDLGLMGEVSRMVQQCGGEVEGYIPQHLTEKEKPSRAANVTLTPDMHTRKWSMYKSGDGLAILPGGIGTLEEFFEMLTWNQLGLHSKPMVVLNLYGFWDPLFALLKHLQEQGFIPDRIKYDCLYEVDRVEAILPTMREHLQTRNVVRLQGAAS